MPRAAWKDRPNSRVRQRAQALYLAHRGYGRIALSALFEVDVDSIRAWLDGWEQAGLRGLYDDPRSGRPPIYTPTDAAQRCGARGWRKNLAYFRRRTLAWKRRRGKRPTARRCVGLSKNLLLETVPTAGQRPRDETAFRTAHMRLKKLHQGHLQGIIELFYFDQSGFTLTPMVPYAWQLPGQTRAIPGADRFRLNVLGLISPTNQSYFQTVTGSVTTATVMVVLDAFAAQTARDKQLSLVVLDNAPIYTSRTLQARINDWFRQGVALHWLPPYSSELNLIEILWHKIKYQWLPHTAYLYFNYLQSELKNALNQFGSKYKITFGELLIQVVNINTNTFRSANEKC